MLRPRFLTATLCVALVAIGRQATAQTLAQQTELAGITSTSVSISGTTALVGSSPANNLAGAVYVLTESGGSWSLHQTITANDGAPFDAFGGSVAIDGTTAFIGASGQASANGAVYVYVNNNGVWTFRQKLLPAIAGGAFGGAVSLSGNLGLVGASVANTAIVFAADANGNWSQQAVLQPSRDARKCLCGVR